MTSQPFPQRLSLITLGVTDVAMSRAFYEGLGFQASDEPSSDVAFFDMEGVILGLFGRNALADDAGLEALGGRAQGEDFHGTSVAVNLSSKAEVDSALAFVAEHGGKITQPARDVFWGGYSGYFSDPDGHLWEVAFNPFWTLDDEGRVQLPKAGAAEREASSA
jgi:uncharacterized protein